MSAGTAARARRTPARWLDSWYFSWLTALVFAAVLMLLLPVPGWVIDLSLSLQLAASVVVLLAIAGEPRARPDSLAVFPSLIVGIALCRVAIHVATTRQILAHGDAGELVASLGRAAIADNAVVGVVLLILLGAAQLLVVARGCERVAEVAARFSLDAMPGEQLAIDTELRAQLIDAGQAARRRAALRRESQFYGAMDGAMRFVRGDATIALAIVFIDLAAGLIVGLGVHGMSASAAASSYLMLAVGHGLAAQIPALLVGAAASLAVTRMNSAARAPSGPHPAKADARAAIARFALAPRTLVAVAGFFAVLALLPGWPHAVFAITALLALGLAAWSHRATSDRSSSRSPARPPGAAASALAGAPHDPGRAWEYADDEALAPAPTPALQIELGMPLARLLDAERPGGAFAHAFVRPARRALAARIGVPAPALHVGVLDEPCWRFCLRVRGSLAYQTDVAPESTAEAACAHIVHGAHRALERYAFELVDIGSVSRALDDLARTEPALVRALIFGPADRLRASALIRQLVRERVAVRDLAEVLRALAESAESPGSDVPPSVLVERVRARLARSISAQFAPAGTLEVWRLDPYLEDVLRGAVERDKHGAYLALEPDIARDIAERVAGALSRPAREARRGGPSRPSVLLVSTDVRRFVAELIEVAAPDAVVLCAAELLPEIQVITVAVIGL